MTIANQQYLNRLAEISKDLEKDETLPESSRQLFSKALSMADEHQYAAVTDNSNPVEETFAVLCDACKTAGLHQCQDTRNGLMACRLVWNYSA